MSLAVQHIVPVPFSLLRTNEMGTVSDVFGDEVAVHRLSEMGIHAGVKVQMVRPGYPCIISVNGRRFSVRLDNNVDILVESNAI